MFIVLLCCNENFATQVTHLFSLCWVKSMQEMLNFHRNHTLDLLLVLEAKCLMLGNIFLVHDETLLKGKYLLTVVRILLTCKICSEEFDLSYSLRIHRRSHTIERPFPCNICRKKFRHLQHLKDHKFTNSKIKLHICSLCRKGFCQEKNLNVHLEAVSLS